VSQMCTPCLGVKASLGPKICRLRRKGWYARVCTSVRSLGRCMDTLFYGYPDLQGYDCAARHFTDMS
jgi:hypothetical protein